jgi:hypothetical protein
LALAFESFARVVSASGTVVVSCEAPGSVAGVRISAIGAGCSVGIGVTITNVEISDIRLHGEPGLAPTKLPAPPKPDAD